MVRKKGAQEMSMDGNLNGRLISPSNSSLPEQVNSRMYDM